MNKKEIYFDKYVNLFDNKNRRRGWELEQNAKLLKAIRYICGTILTIGIVTFLSGIFNSGTNSLVPVGIGFTMGAVFIFLIGIFFMAAEEMLKESDYQRVAVVPDHSAVSGKVVPFRKK